MSLLTRNRPNAGHGNLKKKLGQSSAILNWVCVLRDYKMPYPFQKFFILFSGSSTLTNGQYFHGKISKSDFLALSWFSHEVVQNADICWTNFFFFYVWVLFSPSAPAGAEGENEIQTMAQREPKESFAVRFPDVCSNREVDTARSGPLTV